MTTNNDELTVLAKELRAVRKRVDALALPLLDALLEMEPAERWAKNTPAATMLRQLAALNSVQMSLDGACERLDKESGT